jgi:hypothetical protein
MKDQIRSIALATAAFLASAVVLAFCLVTPASADTVPRYGRIGSPEVMQPYNWTGLYIGGGAGVLFYDFEGCSTYPYPKCGSDNDHFFLGDIKLGYDARLGQSNIVVGIFGTWTPEFLVSDIDNVDVDNIYKVGMRAGVVLPDNGLVYGVGGYVRVEGSHNNVGADADGWFLGVGFEKPLFTTQATNLTWGIEYLYHDVDGSTPGVDFGITGHSAMARINLRTSFFGN